MITDLPVIPVEENFHRLTPNTAFRKVKRGKKRKKRITNIYADRRSQTVEQTFGDHRRLNIHARHYRVHDTRLALHRTTK